VGRFETVPMTATGDFLSFRIAGGHDPRRLRVDLIVGGEAVASWTGFGADAFLEVVHPIAELRGQTFSLALIDDSQGAWGHLMLDEIQQFTWRTFPPRPCPAAALH
jgi:non-lysosomal glucosylceramidase